MQKNTLYPKKTTPAALPFRVPDTLQARQEEARQAYERRLRDEETAPHTEGMTPQQRREALRRYDELAPVPLNRESRQQAAFGAFYRPPALQPVDPAATGAKKTILGNLGLLEKQAAEQTAKMREKERRGEGQTPRPAAEKILESLLMPHRLGPAPAVRPVRDAGLEAARSLAAEARQIVESPVADEYERLGSFGEKAKAQLRALWKPIADRPLADYATLGLSKTLDEIAAVRALRKAGRGETPTPGEKLAIEAYRELQNAKAYREAHGGALTGEKVGQAAAQLPDFLLPLGGGNLAAKGAAKLLLKEGVRRAARKAGAEGLYRTAAKVAAHPVGSKIGRGAASALATPLMMPSTAGQAAERLARDYTAGYDETGALRVMQNGETPVAEALGKAYATNLSAAGTEKAGPLLGVPFRLLKTAPSKLGRLVGRTADARLFNNPYGNRVRRTAKEYFNWNGTAQEIGEEYLDNLTEPLLTGEPERIAGNFTPDNVTETAIVTAALGGLFGAAKAGGTAASHLQAATSQAKARQALTRIADPALRQELSDAYGRDNDLATVAANAGKVLHDRQIDRADFEAAADFVRHAVARDVGLWNQAEAEKTARREALRQRLAEQRQAYEGQDALRLYALTGADGSTRYVFDRPDAAAPGLPQVGDGPAGLRDMPLPKFFKMREATFDEYADRQMRDFEQAEESRTERIMRLVQNRNARDLGVRPPAETGKAEARQTNGRSDTKEINIEKETTEETRETAPPANSGQVRKKLKEENLNYKKTYPNTFYSNQESNRRSTKKEGNSDTKFTAVHEGESPRSDIPMKTHPKVNTGALWNRNIKDGQVKQGNDIKLFPFEKRFPQNQIEERRVSIPSLRLPQDRHLRSDVLVKTPPKANTGTFEGKDTDFSPNFQIPGVIVRALQAAGDKRHGQKDPGKEPAETGKAVPESNGTGGKRTDTPQNDNITEHTEHNLQSNDVLQSKTIDKTPYFSTEHLQNTPYKTNNTEQLTAERTEREEIPGIVGKLLEIARLNPRKKGSEQNGLQGGKTKATNTEQNSVSNTATETKTGQNSTGETTETKPQNTGYQYYEGSIGDLYNLALSLQNAKDGKPKQTYKLKLSNVKPTLIQFLNDKKGYENITEDYIHTLDDSAIRHIYNKHGNPQTEILRGQLPIGVEDFERIPDLLETFEKIRFGEDHRRTPLIALGKDYPEGATTYVEEVRTGKKELGTKSMYKTKKKLKEGLLLTMDNNDFQPQSRTHRKRSFTNGLNEETANRILNKSKEKAVTLPPLEPTKKNWEQVFGNKGYTSTPAGNVRTGDKLFNEMQNLPGNTQFSWMAATLKKPELILEMPQKTEGKSNLLYLKTFGNGKRQYHYVINVTVNEDGSKECLRWHTESERNFKKFLENGNPVYMATPSEIKKE